MEAPNDNALKGFASDKNTPMGVVAAMDKNTPMGKFAADVTTEMTENPDAVESVESQEASSEQQS